MLPTLPSPIGMVLSENLLLESPRSQGSALCRGTPPHCKLTSQESHTGFSLELSGFSPAPTQSQGCVWGTFI